MAQVRNPFVSVIVPARDCEDTIGRCLASLLAVEYPPDRREILIVDNGSTDGTAEIVKRHPVTYLFEGRRGPSAARNRGIEAGKGDILVFTEADCVVATGWLRHLVHEFADDQVWGVAGEIVSYPPETPAERYHAGRKVLWQKTALDLTRPYVITANVAFRRETFARIGVFDPHLLTAEDKDLGWRFLRRGDMKLAYSAKALVFHRHRQSGWQLFIQHVGWGYGAALLHRKYGLPWGGRQEVGKYVELLVALGVLAQASLRYAIRGGESMDVYRPFFEVVRRTGLRVGALAGLVAGGRRIGPRVAG